VGALDELAAEIGDAQYGRNYVPKLPSLTPDRSIANRAVFIAFQREQLQTAQEFSQHLTENGLSVFMYDPQILWADTVAAITDRMRNSLCLAVVDSSDAVRPWLQGERAYAQAYEVPIVSVRSRDDLARVIQIVRESTAGKSYLAERLELHKFFITKLALLILAAIGFIAAISRYGMFRSCLIVGLMLIVAGYLARRVLIGLWPEQSFHDRGMQYWREEALVKRCFEAALSQAVQRAEPEYIEVLERDWPDSDRAAWQASPRITELFNASHRIFDVPYGWEPAPPSTTVLKFARRWGVLFIVVGFIRLLGGYVLVIWEKLFR
jgi:hypothetical protein